MHAQRENTLWIRRDRWGMGGYPQIWPRDCLSFPFLNKIHDFDE